MRRVALVDYGKLELQDDVPTDVTMNFQNSRFSGNRVDIDNRCGQPLDLTQAIFE